MANRLAGCAGTMLVLLAAISTASAKQHSRFVTGRMRANALENAKKHSWAGKEQKEAVSAAERWVKMSDERLWEIITSQELPRSIYTNPGIIYAGKKPRCPNCGEGIVRYGGYAWKSDFWNRPWKLKCRNCEEVYPKNDFHAFYTTALDEQGMFRRKLGDRGLLFNAEHPDPDDPLHKLFVDDGYGMVDEKGNKHHMIAVYNQWGQWQAIQSGLSALVRAYTLTSDKVYAHKAAVLLDRISDVYPEMDYLPLHRMGFQHSQGGTGRGRIQGCIWETHMREMARAYDSIYDGIQDDQQLVKFSSEKAARHKLGDKSSIRKICRHIEEQLLLEILKSCKDGRIAGNTGMTHTCLAITAIALDRPEMTRQWLDWLFDPRFPGQYTTHKDPIPWVLVEGLDRDGMGGECGGYGLIWTRGSIDLARILATCPQYSSHNIVKEYPKLKQCFLIESRLNCLDAVFPPIGDSGGTGTWGRLGSAARFAEGFKLYKDPRLAALAWRYAAGNPDRLRLPGDIFEEDPTVLARKIAAVAAKSGSVGLRCEQLGRYGQAVLQTEKRANGRAIWIHYGYGKGHSHRDCLNLGLYAKNIDMLPELGYPEYTGSWPKRHAWTANTISHNTLLVGDRASGYSPGGKIGLFAMQPPVRVIDVSSKTAYKGLKSYRRTAALVDVSQDDGYVFDVFRARGGTNHRLSYHGPARQATLKGLELVEQGKGTFAGPDVEFAKLDGPRSAFYKSSGFSYLYDVQRSKGPVEDCFTVDWKAEDARGRITKASQPHLRLHALTVCDEVALASGDPPQKPGNPRSLRYLIQSRLGENMESQFVTVLEPYEKTPFIRRVRRLQVQHQSDPNSVAAVAVELQKGITDVLISCRQPVRVEVEGGIQFEGQFGMLRLAGGQVKCMRMCNARLLKCSGTELTSKLPAYRGKVTRVDAGDPENNLVFLEPALPPDAGLVGKTIHFAGQVPWDTSYEIKALEEGSVSTGDITIVAGFQDPGDFNSGYKYLVNPGDRYVLPICTALDR